MEALLSSATDWIQTHPHWAGIFVMFIAALESFLVIGLFVPGTVVMFGIGAMVAAGTMELVPTLIWAVIGAVIGDVSSYYIGRHYHQQLREMWPFRKYPNLIARGVDFFHQHGGKSVVLARFAGPVRPLLPAVAGMLDMPARRFMLVNIFSALLWAPAYLLPGLLFGASLGVATEIAGRLALLLIILVALLWFSWWLMQQLVRGLQPHAHALQVRTLDWSRRHPHLQPLGAALLDPQHPEARGMTLLTAMLIIASWALLSLPVMLASGGLLDNLDLYLFHQLQTLRSPFGDRLMVMITGIGSNAVLYGFMLLLSSWLLWQRHWRMSLHWVVTVLCVSLLTQALKAYTAVERPPLLDTSAMSYAFPSAHASVSVAVFGFLAVAIARELRSNWHWLPYSAAVFLVVSISFSRLYLGVHWLSDVLGGWSLGLMWVALLGIAYRQHPAPHISARLFAPAALAALLLVAVPYSAHYLEPELAAYQPQASHSLPLQRTDWHAAGWASLPAYRDDFEGRHQYPLNIQWLGELADIHNELLQHGWRQPRSLHPGSVLNMFNGAAGISSLPVLPQLHRGELQQLLLVRDLQQPPRLLTLRLWPSGYADSGQPLWLGSVSYLHIDAHFRLFRFLHTDPDFDAAQSRFAAELAQLGSYRIQQQPLPASPNGSQWNRRLLLIDGG
jgi:undecaprenyl-diphosphatase